MNERFSSAFSPYIVHALFMLQYVTRGQAQFLLKVTNSDEGGTLKQFTGIILTFATGRLN